jgi:gas vesicle protein
MAYEYDRFEREDGGGSFLMGLLAGTVLGAGLGMLFAPRPGSELRNQLTEQAGRLRHTAGDAYSQASGTVNKMVDRGREAYDRARHSSGSMDTGMGSTSDVGSQVGSSVGSMTDR